MEGTSAKNGIQLFVSLFSFQVGEDFHREFDWIETRGAYTSQVSLAQQFLETKAKDRKHKVASEASGESNERVRIGPITLTQGESIAWFPTSRKGLGLDVNYPRLHREIATTTTTLERTEWRALYLSNEWWGDWNRFCRSGFPLSRKGRGRKDNAIHLFVPGTRHNSLRKARETGKAGIKLFTSSGYEPYLASKANPFTSEILPNSNYKERKGFRFYSRPLDIISYQPHPGGFRVTPSCSILDP
ncbi:hypothetical protein VNO80_16489 [Phaseolus coccineus]|uniref:Uncharacterized protein n=1 Tax=Phaseolus coccineus TaxID=3886 RepID=A0AAN9MNM8_PHACN